MSTTVTTKDTVAMTTTQASIQIYNTLSKAKEPLVPLEPGKIGMYLCGPTVYKPSHIGHMVGPVIFDAVKRYLTYSGFEVTFVINVTDVDDKLIAESTAREMTMAALASEMTDDYMRNLEAMGVDTVDHFPRATDNMDEIIEFTQELIDKGFAYAADGDVYFEVCQDSEYGKLSHRSLESLQGAGGEMAARKRAATDFALWKSAKAGEPSWDSPWGPGRPGWHIECSAMSRKLLGPSFDIHGGGLDLVFPHHENEIAQSECCHGKPQAKYWMHNGLMQAADETGKVGGRQTKATDENEQDADAQAATKISKSTGAGAFSELLDVHQAETIRLLLLSTHYRRPIYFSEQQLRNIATGLDTFYRFFDRFERITGESFYSLPYPATREEGDRHLEAFAAVDDKADPRNQIHAARQRYLAAMDDDFNSGAAVGDLFELVRLLNKFVDAEKLERSGGDEQSLATLKRGASVLRELAATLGLFREAIVDDKADDSMIAPLVELLIEVRKDSRDSKNFALADKIRDALTKLNIVLEDRPDGTIWRIES